MKRAIFLAMAALLAMLILVPMAVAHDDGGYRVGTSGSGSGERWSCHPSAGSGAAPRVGHPDLRDSAAQVVTN